VQRLRKHAITNKESEEVTARAISDAMATLSMMQRLSSTFQPEQRNEECQSPTKPLNPLDVDPIDEAFEKWMLANNVCLSPEEQVDLEEQVELEALGSPRRARMEHLLRLANSAPVAMHPDEFDPRSPRRKAPVHRDSTPTKERMKEPEGILTPATVYFSPGTVYFSPGRENLTEELWDVETPCTEVIEAHASNPNIRVAMPAQALQGKPTRRWAAFRDLFACCQSHKQNVAVSA